MYTIRGLVLFSVQLVLFISFFILSHWPTAFSKSFAFVNIHFKERFWKPSFLWGFVWSYVNGFTKTDDILSVFVKNGAMWTGAFVWCFPYLKSRVCISEIKILIHRLFKNPSYLLQASRLLLLLVSRQLQELLWQSVGAYVLSGNLPFRYWE